MFWKMCFLFESLMKDGYQLMTSQLLLAVFCHYAKLTVSSLTALSVKAENRNDIMKKKNNPGCRNPSQLQGIKTYKTDQLVTVTSFFYRP